MPERNVRYLLRAIGASSRTPKRENATRDLEEEDSATIISEVMRLLVGSEP